jgi:hypothetical protein
MAITSVIDGHLIDWAQVLVACILAIVGIGMLVAPVKMSGLFAWLNRGGPGELLTYNQPRLVGQSRWMRLNLRLLGALFVGVAIALLSQLTRI